MSATPIDDGGPAYPAPDLGQRDFGDRSAYPGKSLRDEFAGRAMQTMLSLCQRDAHEGSYLDYVAGVSYRMADAMLRARKART